MKARGPRAGLAILAVVFESAAALAAEASPPAASEERFPMPLGARVRHVAPAGDTAVEAAALVTATMVKEGRNISASGIFALGRGASQTTGTLVLRYAQGVVLGPGDSPTRGLSLRGGTDVAVDSAATLRVSELALPLLQAGYIHGTAFATFDAGVEAAPVLAGRLRYDGATRELGFGAKGGVYASVLFLRIGLSAQLTASHLIASTAEGGAADWGRAIACINVIYVDLCADGFVSRLAPADAGAVTAGYAGGVVGLSLPTLGRLMRY